MMKKLIECVPNISEGRNMNTINSITEVIKKCDGVRLLNVDPGKATNRTVITFIGEPEPVLEAAYQLISKSKELIDMRNHKGEHPRMGAVDVCPLVPISNTTIEETAAYAHRLSERVGKELGIPVYCYERAAKKKERVNLANCRSGEYEGLQKKISTKNWKPDYGPNNFNSSVEKSGATAIAARDFLIAYNVNINTTSTRRANSIAFDLREAGRIKREGEKLNGKILKDKKGNVLREPGHFKNLKGIGWYIEEYGIAQISYNLTNINTTPLHEVFDKTCERAQIRGLRVTGSELIGLVPKKVLIDAGKYFLVKQKRSLAIPDKDIIHIAIKSLGLDELSKFNPNERIIEYLIKTNDNPLAKMTITDFANETSSESPAPGGGSIAAYCGVLGSALATMVANLSAHKRGWDDRWEFFSKWGEKGIGCQNQLLDLVDRDTHAFNEIMNAYSLPKENSKQIAIRNEEIQKATKNAINVPFEIMKTSFDSIEVIMKMAEEGNPNSISDAGVAMHCARAAIMGAFLNVKINCKDLEDKNYVKKTIKSAKIIIDKTNLLEARILKIVEEKL
ncbi:MAG: glutamate formimidoyltransferase [Flavobacteriaceae bacterium]|nr:glutamate formimidoyltransferase [Flavobacteriaceae bacterium]MBT4112638.1 glutamate formimidoyltransferase [Flavobacteriaceae bacterium]MBT4614491.1 glutamate formimidoyltransferase [Flavobacteriaceae bacterium]MBT5246944.1 glutamate formimidoyltransferase [Flavobacteriaceae bacterium]MBT5650128.1 glutamate formimidoyltransferase [Flavobacteriaceae bacterium]